MDCPRLDKMLALSTAHVTQETAERFNTQDCDLPVYPKKSRGGDIYGWFVCVGDADREWVHTKADEEAHDQDIRDVCAFAERMGCAWVMFDCDEEPIEELPVYVW